jgi:hypothetical protein
MSTQRETVPTTQPTPTQPSWWSYKNISAWERVRDAFKRDWSQTQADFAGSRGEDLNQTAADTLKQAVGPGGVPPLDVKTHPDTPTQVEVTKERLLKDMTAQTQKVTVALRGIRHEEAALQETLQGTRAAAATEQREADSASLRTRKELDQKATAPGSDVTAERAVATSWSADAAAAIVKRTQLQVDDAAARSAGRLEEDRAMVAKGTAAHDAAAQRWRAMEPAARYGFTAHSQYPGQHAWSAPVEEALSAEWQTLSSGASWDVAKDDIRRGWDYADKEVDAEPPHEDEKNRH